MAKKMPKKHQCAVLMRTKRKVRKAWFYFVVLSNTVYDYQEFERAYEKRTLMRDYYIDIRRLLHEIEAQS